jgi:hypothetical protein
VAACENAPPGVVDALEPRLVLASYSLGDYLAAADGDRWSFRGTSDAASVTATLDIRGDVRAANGANFDMRIGSGFLAADIERRIKKTGAGLFELSEESTVLGEGARTTFASPLRLLPLSFSDGQRFDFSMGVSVTVLPEGTPTITGTMTGVLQILGTENVTAPAGTFSCVHARLTTHAQATFQGSTGTVVATEDWWLTRSVGFVRIDSSQTSSGDGETETTSYSVSLVSSSLLAPPGEIAIAGNGLAIFHNDTTPRTADFTAFGNVKVAGGAKVRVFTIRNQSASNTLNLGTITLAGSNASDFRIVHQPARRTLQPGESTTFRVRFDPSAAGTRKTTVVIASNDLDENPFRFRIRGQGTLVPTASSSVAISLNLLHPAEPPRWTGPGVDAGWNRTSLRRYPGLVIRGSNQGVHIRFSGLGVSTTHHPSQLWDCDGSFTLLIRINSDWD